MSLDGLLSKLSFWTDPNVSYADLIFFQAVTALACWLIFRDRMRRLEVVQIKLVRVVLQVSSMVLLLQRRLQMSFEKAESVIQALDALIKILEDDAHLSREKLHKTRPS